MTELCLVYPQKKLCFLPALFIQFPILKDMNLKPDVSLPWPSAKPVTAVLCLFDFSVFHLYPIKCFELLIPKVVVLRKYDIEVAVNNFQAHV